MCVCVVRGGEKRNELSSSFRLWAQFPDLISVFASTGHTIAHVRQIKGDRSEANEQPSSTL